MFYFFAGILSFQIIYILTQWQKYHRLEYVYYCLYLFCMIGYYFILVREAAVPVTETGLADKIMGFIKRPLVLVTFLLYVLFAEHFMEIKRYDPAFNRLFRMVKLFTLGLIVVLMLLYPWKDSPVSFWAFRLGNLAIMLISLYVIFRMMKVAQKLAIYILKGSLYALAGSLLTNILDSLPVLSWNRYRVDFETSLIPSQLGILMQTYFFIAGLSFKAFATEKEVISMQEKLIMQLNENEKLLIEREQIRNKIAQDLHDDIGATLSGIALHSHMARMLIDENKTESVLKSLHLIETGAVDMVNNLNDVVWSVNPKNDSVEQFMERLKEYAFAMTQAKSIQVNWKVDNSIRDIKLPMEYRKNIYLICKEAVNNAVKYADCHEITITGMLANPGIVFSVCDDGKGFINENQSRGNGLKNMQERAEENKMKIEIESSPERGTIISVHCQITQ